MSPGVAESRSYYGRPVIKAPVWTAEVPLYFFAGGLAGASACLGAGARLVGNEPLERRAWGAALAGIAVSPPLLISDLGRPERFYNMLRVLRPTSPMSVGSWLLSACGVSIGLGALDVFSGRLPRTGAAARTIAAVLGPPLSTYTAVLVANTAVPVWHEARRELPFVFAGSSAASAGALAAALTPSCDAGPARRLAVAGAALELTGVAAMERRLGDLAEPYRRGSAGRLARLAKGLTGTGAAVLATRGRRSRVAAIGGAGLVLSGSLCERFAVYRAGFASAQDPRFTVGPQRERVARRRDRHAISAETSAMPQ